MDFPSCFAEVSSNVQKILESQEDDAVLLTSLVTLGGRISDLMLFVHSSKNGTALSDKKKAAIEFILSQITFYCLVIARLRDLGLDQIDDEVIETASESLDPVFSEDRYLCVNNMMLCAGDLMDIIYNPPYEPETDDDEEEPVLDQDSVEAARDEADALEAQEFTLGVDGSTEQLIYEGGLEFECMLEFLATIHAFISSHEDLDFARILRLASQEKEV